MADIKEIENAIEIFENILKCNEIIDGNGYSNNSPIPLALEALQEKLTRENPKPLTLDELKQMIGQPVYRKFKNEDSSGYTVVVELSKEYDSWYFSEVNEYEFCHNFDDCTFYRHKPK